MREPVGMCGLVDSEAGRSDCVNGWLPDRVGELHESGMTGDSPGSRAIHVLASISTDLSSHQSVILREMRDQQNHDRRFSPGVPRETWPQP